MYQHGKRTKQPRSFKILLGVAGILGLAIVVAAVILVRDSGKQSEQKSGGTIVTEIGEDGEDSLKIDEPMFSFELPVDWKLAERRNDEHTNFYIWNSTKQGGNDRKLTLHIDRLPQSYKLVKMLPLSPSDDKFILGNISDDCADFASTQGNAAVEAKWEGVIFMCDPIRNNQTIGTGSVEGGIGSSLKGHNYFFYYEDHNIHPDNNILTKAIRSFRAK